MQTLLYSRRVLISLLTLAMVVVLGLGLIHAQDEKVLVIGHSEATDSLDPARGYNQTTGIVLKAAYDTLVTFPDTDASAIVPQLAESFEISDDGLTYTFKLRSDIKFASGNSLTADDVVFSILRDKNVKGNPSFLFGNVAGAEASDAQTAVVTLSQPDPAFLAILAGSWGSIVDSKVVIENGGSAEEGADTADTAEAYLNGTSAGTGPYVLESWEPQVQTVLVRNANYWGNTPYFDRVIITNMPEAASQKSAVEAGDIDLATDLSGDQAKALEGNADVVVHPAAGNIIHFLLMNRDPEVGGPVSNPKVAEAIRYALDYDGFKTLWGGVQPGTNLTVGFAGAFGEDKAIKRDTEKAKALLAEAGYPDGFEITLDYPDFVFQGVDMNTNAQKIQSDLAEVGIKVTLAKGDLQTKLEGYRGGTEAMGYWFWGPDFTDSKDFLAFLPGGPVASNRAKWTLEDQTQEIQDLIAQAGVESNPDKRTEIFTKLQEYAQTEGAFAPFIQPGIRMVGRANLNGVIIHPQWILDVAQLSRS
ncbi:MAG: ABC transporter substrate-binding protein [Anaerolineae bacterium]